MSENDDDKPSRFSHTLPCVRCGATIKFHWLWENDTYPRFAYWTRCVNCVAAEFYRSELRKFYHLPPVIPAGDGAAGNAGVHQGENSESQDEGGALGRVRDRLARVELSARGREEAEDPVD